MAKGNRKQVVELTREQAFGSYEAWTSPTYSEVRGTKGNVVKRIRGLNSAAEARREAQDLAAVFAAA